jgi:methyl-accepting chemotaxis protein
MNRGGIDQVALAESEMDRVTQQNASLYNNLAAAALEERNMQQVDAAVSTFRSSLSKQKLAQGALNLRQPTLPRLLPEPVS